MLSSIIAVWLSYPLAEKNSHSCPMFFWGSLQSDVFSPVTTLINSTVSGAGGAGILRDKSVANTSDNDWDLIHRNTCPLQLLFRHQDRMLSCQVCIPTCVSFVTKSFGIVYFTFVLI
ncbi:hypothetical protein OUZ56_022256 [Daphnia magna]|uniref:Uncharacterized protein n=1 Tax=Daphnia magna TaxID=35525 RepID=A0ABR0AVY9_9CRUS|nr:hypothetical protein OUZ56_022256 [Daphnia magna]